MSISPLDVWEGYDPSKEPLDIEVINEWKENEISFQEIYFTGRQIGQEKVRIYAVYSSPAGSGKKPGILHIHGGGQTVNQKWLKFWSERGYAVLSYNWGGEWPNRERYTLWGPLTHANHKKVEPTATKQPSQAYDSWYDWTAAAMRALTFLEAQPEVDRDKLGAFGTSMGGSIVWRIAAIDKRLKAACAIYGCGWEEHAEFLKYYESDIGEEANPRVLKWNTLMAPQAFAPYLKTPILYLSGTNDFWGNMDRAFDTLGAVPKNIERRQAFTPGFNHHVGNGFDMNLPCWMDQWLKIGESWPKTPEVEIVLDQKGIPQLSIIADGSQDIQNVEVYYAVENTNAYFRHWRKEQGTKNGRIWSASLPVCDILNPVFALANITYVSRIVLSSNLATAVPYKLGNAKATDLPANLLFDASRVMDSYMDGWMTNSPCTDPIPPIPVPLKVVQGPDEIKGLAIIGNYSLHTYKVGDPKWRGKNGNQLYFKVLSRKAGTFTVVAGCMKGSVQGGTSELFNCTVNIEGKDGWQNIELPEKVFKSDDGNQTLEDWSKVNYLQMKRPDSQWMDENIMFSDFKWI